ncbi:MAG: hypothetical protein GVY07_03645 [Bacteroidetes bacterium]|nr:hypothetical protein [Bacteroidota bacterium]
MTFFFIQFYPHQTYSQAGVEFGGYLQAWYIANHDEDVLYTSTGNLPVLNVQTEHSSSFKIRRARLTAKGTISESFSIRSWVELTAENRSLLDLYLDAKLSEKLTLRFGQMVMPGQSYDTSRHFSSKLLLVERPSVTTKISSMMGYNAFRDVGIVAYGTLGKLWYGFQISNGLGRIHQSGFTFFDRNFGSGLIGGRVDYEIIEGVELGAHLSTNQQRNLIQHGSEPIDINRTSWSLRASFENLLVPGFFANAEYISFHANDDNWDISSTHGEPFSLSGFYTLTGYNISRNWNISARFDQLTENSGKLTATPDFSSVQYTFGVTRLIHHNSSEIARLHLDYSFSESGPMDLNESMIVLALQLKFIP